MRENINFKGADRESDFWLILLVIRQRSVTDKNVKRRIYNIKLLYRRKCQTATKNVKTRTYDSKLTKKYQKAYK